LPTDGRDNPRCWKHREEERCAAAPARGKAAASKPATEKEEIARAFEDGVVVFLFVERTLTTMLEDCIATVKFVARSLAAAS
jgi:hypothetical protein